MFEVVVKLRVYKIWVAVNEVASWAQVLPDGTPLSEPWPWRVCLSQRGWSVL